MISLFAENPLIFVIFIIIILISLSVHEFAHALAAYELGDDTAYLFGRLTLNPKAHIDWLGAISFLFFGFGWGKPVPVNPFAFKNPRRDNLIVALAGPFANLLLVILATILFKIVAPFLTMTNLLIYFLILTIQINLILMFFNLIPLPPLDGYNVINYLLPKRYQAVYLRYGYLFFLTIIIASLLFNIPIFNWMYNLIYSYFSFFNLPLI